MPTLRGAQTCQEKKSERTLSPALFALRQSQCLQSPPNLLRTVCSSPQVRVCGFPLPLWMGSCPTAGPWPELLKLSTRKLLLFSNLAN